MTSYTQAWNISKIFISFDIIIIMASWLNISVSLFNIGSKYRRQYEKCLPPSWVAAIGSRTKLNFRAAISIKCQKAQTGRGGAHSPTNQQIYIYIECGRWHFRQADHRREWMKRLHVVCDLYARRAFDCVAFKCSLVINRIYIHQRLYTSY